MLREISITKGEGESLKEEVYKLLRELILVNELLPGQKLSIEELARELDISPTPVREALAKLDSDGLLELSRNKKPRVTQITEDDVGETYEVRRMLEPQVAKKATNNLPMDQLRNLKDKMVKLSTKDKENKSQIFHELDMELNKLIFDSIDNNLLDKVLSVVNNRSVRIRFLAESVHQRDRGKLIEKGNKEHMGIIEAMESLDEKKVKVAIQEHLTNAEERTIRMIRELKSKQSQTIDIKKYLY